MIECNSFLRKFESMTSIKVLQVEWRQGLAIRKSLKESRNKTGGEKPQTYSPVWISCYNCISPPKFVEYLFASPIPPDYKLPRSGLCIICHHDANICHNSLRIAGNTHTLHE